MAKRSESHTPFGHHAATSLSSDDSSSLQLSPPAIFPHHNALYAQQESGIDSVRLDLHSVVLTLSYSLLQTWLTAVQ